MKDYKKASTKMEDRKLVIKLTDNPTRSTGYSTTD